MVLEGQVSYRQVGTNKSLGRVATQKRRRVRTHRSTPSIPSKFETTLHFGRSERNGFGGRTFRFQNDHQKADVPAPGSYYRASTLERDSDNTSRAGYGSGFASRAKRFGAASTKLLDAADQPGPGSYNARKAPNKVSHSAADCSSNFAPPRRYRDEVQIPAPTDLVPGPSEYHLRRDAAKPPQATSAVSSAFRSRTHRGAAPLAGRDAPPPDRYKPTSTFGAVLPGQQGGQSSRLPSAVFRSTAAKVAKELFYPEETATGKLPGPGDYNAPEAHRSANTDLINLAQQSSTFANAQQDRWGRPYEQRVAEQSTPGPGWYGSEKERPYGIASSSFFMSSSKRTAGNALVATGAGGGRLPPGPAYYTPVGSLKKSFLLNPTRRWV